MEPLPPAATAAIDTPAAPKRRRWFWRSLLLVLVLIAAVFAVLMWRWSTPPAAFDPLVQARARNGSGALVVGVATTATLARVGEMLLDKHGGYLSNDVTPPSLFLDDMPNWEFGVIEQNRDLALALRRDFSRSLTQSIEDKDLAEAQPLFSTTNDRWLLPSTESQYRAAIERIDAYRIRLGDGDANDAQFYARADNLAAYLAMVEARLGSLSQRLSAAVGPTRQDTDLANDPAARQSKPNAAPREVRTPWRDIDDVFYGYHGVGAQMPALEFVDEPSAARPVGTVGAAPGAAGADTPSDEQSPWLVAGLVLAGVVVGGVVVWGVRRRPSS